MRFTTFHTAFFLLSIVTLTPVYAQDTNLEPPSIGIEALTNTANLVRSFEAKDEFDTPPNASSLTGRRFSVDVDPRKRGPSNSICDGFPSWGYFSSLGKYEVSFTPARILVGYLNTPFSAAFTNTSNGVLNFTSFTCQKINGGSYRATNAFGAVTTVERRKDVVIAFSDVGDTRSNMVDVLSVGNKRYWSSAISGDLARKLSVSVKVRISGTIDRWPNGQNILCGMDKKEAKFDWPYEETVDACIFRTKGLTFEVIDTRTNDILNSMKANQAN